MRRQTYPDVYKDFPKIEEGGIFDCHQYIKKETKRSMKTMEDSALYEYQP